MQEKKYSDAAKEIRSVLLTYPNGVFIEEFLKTYHGLIGQRLPSSTYGFRSDREFLESMPEVVSVCIGNTGRVHLTGIADEKSVHIQSLVSRQRKTKPNNNKSCNRQPNRRLPIVEEKYTAPFLPGPLRAEILQVMSMYNDGVTFPAFALAYKRKFNKCLPLLRGLDSLEGMINLIPELEIQTENGLRRICHKKSNDNIEERNSANSSPSSKVQGKTIPEAKNSFHIHESGISDDVLQNFHQLMEKCSEGVLDIHFAALYENLTQKTFDLHKLGYNSIAELVDALPYLFKRVLNPRDNKSWIILPAEAKIKHCLTDDSPRSRDRRQYLQKTGGIPADAASPILQYIQPTIPEHVDLSQYLPVFVSAIINPSLFWFQLQTNEAAKSFESFEKDLGSFYNSYSSNYKMNIADVVIGATCVIQSPDDEQWYRAVIKSFPSVDLVNVSYVDYGSTDNIPKTNLFYVRSKYHDYPACGFKAQLANVKPPQNASVWSMPSQQRFVQLCSSGILMANLISVDKDTHLVYLCDTTGEKDLHITDVLINEGFAELSYENNVNLNNTNFQKSPTELTISDKTKVDSGLENSSRSDQDLSHSDKSDSISEPDVLSVKRKLFSTPQKMQYNGTSSKVSPCGKGQISKRYVKLLQLCEDTKMHFINFDGKLYMSTGDIAKLIWSNKDSSFLIERLRYKEVHIPFLKLSKENNMELFKQCIWYKIPEFDTLLSSNSSLIICSLECALNILNVFGHPSICLRLAIQDEIRRFDQHDAIWKEFYYEESDDMEKEIEQKLSKLCLYDLRAKSEALKIKRLKLSLIKDSSVDKEIEMVEMHQNIIAKRMKQIEAICCQYGSS